MSPAAIAAALETSGTGPGEVAVGAEVCVCAADVVWTVVCELIAGAALTEASAMRIKVEDKNLVKEATLEDQEKVAEL